VLEWLLLGLSSPLLIALFARYYRRAYPVHPAPTELQSKQDAVRQAIECVRQLTGLDVTGWQAHAALHSDDETLERLHQLGQAGRQRGFLARCGLTGAWRVRFIDPSHGTVLVGLSSAGEVLLFDMAGPIRKALIEQHAAVAEFEESTVLSHLSGAAGSFWAGVRHTGDGRVALDEYGEQQIWHFRVANELVRIDLTVETTGQAVLRVDSTTEVVMPQEQADRAEQREALAGAGGTLGSVLAIAGGVLILVLLPTGQLPMAALVLGGVALLAAVCNEAIGAERAIVNAYAGSVSWRVFRLINASMSVVSVVVTTAVVLIAALAGEVVANRIGIPIFHDPLRQLSWGLWLGLAWLGLAAAAFTLLRNAGIAHISETPDRRTLRLGGLGARQIVGIVAQSAVAEEVVFRLLGVSVLLWAIDSPVIAAIVTAALWASMHAGSAVAPRWVRQVELLVVGTVLGLVAIEFGVLTAIVAHALFNAVTLLVPVLAKPVSSENHQLNTERTAHA
jgi:hypothetical protein